MYSLSIKNIFVNTDAFAIKYPQAADLPDTFLAAYRGLSGPARAALESPRAEGGTPALSET